MEEHDQAAISNNPKRAQLQDPPPDHHHSRPQQQQQRPLPDDHSSHYQQTQHPSPLSPPPQTIIKNGTLDQSRQKLNLTVRPRAAGSESEKSEKSESLEEMDAKGPQTSLNRTETPIRE